MSWWTKQKILKVIMYILLAFVFVNCFLFEIRPTIYPDWLRDGIGITGLFVIVFWFIWCIVYLIKRIKTKRKNRENPRFSPSSFSDTNDKKS